MEKESGGGKQRVCEKMMTDDAFITKVLEYDSQALDESPQVVMYCVLPHSSRPRISTSSLNN